MGTTKKTDFKLERAAVDRLRHALAEYHRKLPGGAIGSKNVGGDSSEEAALVDELFKHATPLIELAERSVPK